MTKAVQCRYKYLDLTNASLEAWIKRSLVLPKDTHIVKVVSGPRETDFRVVLGSKEFGPVDIGTIPALKPEFRRPQKYCNNLEHCKPGTSESNINPYLCQICQLPFSNKVLGKP